MSKEKTKKTEEQVEILETSEVQDNVSEVSKEEELEQQIKDMENKYLRLAAEYDNYQKRTTREKEARYSDAVIDTAASFVSVADNLERALAIEVESEEARKVLDGVKMVYKQFCDSLTALGITPIDAVGEQFDPNLHNAVMHVEDETIDDNTIIEEFMKGYIYKDSRVVRHSMVKVAN